MKVHSYWINCAKTSYQMRDSTSFAFFCKRLPLGSVGVQCKNGLGRTVDSHSHQAELQCPGIKVIKVARDIEMEPLFINNLAWNPPKSGTVMMTISPGFSTILTFRNSSTISGICSRLCHIMTESNGGTFSNRPKPGRAKRIFQVQKKTATIRTA